MKQNAFRSSYLMNDFAGEPKKLAGTPKLLAALQPPSMLGGLVPIRLAGNLSWHVP